MNVTPPEGTTEYSRGVERSGARLAHDSGAAARARSSARGTPGARPGPRPGPLSAAILAGTMLGAVLLLVAEFTTLFEVHTAQATATVRSVGTGSHHGYALVPIALLAAAFGCAVWAAASRPALVAIGALGVLALVIALLGDLPDTNASGLVLSASHYTTANSTPSAGFYMETLGAVVLLITSVSGFLLIGAPGGGRRKRGRAPAGHAA